MKNLGSCDLQQCAGSRGFGAEERALREQKCRDEFQSIGLYLTGTLEGTFQKVTVLKVYFLLFYHICNLEKTRVTEFGWLPYVHLMMSVK